MLRNRALHTGVIADIEDPRLFSSHVGISMSSLQPIPPNSLHIAPFVSEDCQKSCQLEH